jgi:hypothetical protein
LPRTQTTFDFTPYLAKKFCRWVTQSGIEVVLMLAWVMITSPVAAGSSVGVVMNRTREKAKQKFLIALFIMSTFDRRAPETRRLAQNFPEYSFNQSRQATLKYGSAKRRIII